MIDLGFGFVEIGSVTPEPQPGNDRPRLFRLKEDEAIINRYGFNSIGINAIKKRLYNIRKKYPNVLLGINLGKNKSSTTANDTINDYVSGTKNLAPFADYLVINISSPNTPGLIRWQYAEGLEQLLSRVIITRDELNLGHKQPPILLKISPDLSLEEVKNIVTVCQNVKIDGIVVSNTTQQRPNYLSSRYSKESGGLSGKPLMKSSTELLGIIYRLTNGNIPLIGVGGISDSKDAYQKIKAGASLIQLYTALIYKGPGIVEKIKKDLETLLLQDGYDSISKAVGRDVIVKKNDKDLFL